MLPAVRDSPELAAKVKELGDEAVGEAATGGAARAALQRTAADLFAVASRLSTNNAASLIKSLCQRGAEPASLPQRAALALATGSAARAVGGLGLPSVLPISVQTLAALADASDKTIAPWVLHALLHLARAAGLSFVPHVRRTLAIAQVRFMGVGWFPRLLLRLFFLLFFHSFVILRMPGGLLLRELDAYR